MLNCSKTPKRLQSQMLLYNKMAKPPRVHGCGLDTFSKKSFQLQQGMSNAQRLDQGSS